MGNIIQIKVGETSSTFISKYQHKTSFKWNFDSFSDYIQVDEIMFDEKHYFKITALKKGYIQLSYMRAWDLYPVDTKEILIYE